MSILNDIVNKYGVGESVGIKLKKEKKNPYIAACENKLLYIYGENNAFKDGINDIIDVKYKGLGEKFSFGVPDWEISNAYFTRRQVRGQFDNKYGQPKTSEDKDVYGDGAVTVIYDDDDIVKTMISTKGSFRGKWFTDRYNISIGESKEDFLRKAGQWFYEKGDYYLDKSRNCKIYFKDNKISKIVVEFNKEQYLKEKQERLERMDRVADAVDTMYERRERRNYQQQQLDALNRIANK